MPSPSVAPATSAPAQRASTTTTRARRRRARPRPGAAVPGGGPRLPSSPPATSRAAAAAVALERDRLDAVITRGSSSSGMRRSEVSSARYAARVASWSPRPSSQASRRRSAPGQTRRPPPGLRPSSTAGSTRDGTYDTAEIRWVVELLSGSADLGELDRRDGSSTRPDGELRDPAADRRYRLQGRPPAVLPPRRDRRARSSTVQPAPPLSPADAPRGSPGVRPPDALRVARPDSSARLAASPGEYRPLGPAAGQRFPAAQVKQPVEEVYSLSRPVQAAWR